MATALALPENRRIQLVAHEHFNRSDIDVSTQIAKIKASNAQVLIAWTTGTPFGKVLRSIADTGLSIPVATNSGNVTYAQMKQYASFLPKLLYFPGVSYLAERAVVPAAKPTLTAFLDSIARQGMRPDTPAGMAWDPATILADALRLLGSGASADQVHRFIEHLHGYPGISGVYDFTTRNQRGIGVKDLLILRRDSGAAT